MLYQLSYASAPNTSKREGLERETGLEPATNSLEGCHSTLELLPPRAWSTPQAAGQASEISFYGKPPPASNGSRPRRKAQARGGCRLSPSAPATASLRGSQNAGYLGYR